jgi:hypothetical protein
MDAAPLIGFLIYGTFLLMGIGIAGYVVGWTFRKGWDRAGRR